MRDDQLRRLLRERNPWWHAVATGGDPTAWAQHDPALRPAAESGITYFPDVVADLRPPMLVLVRGPRRVGKSVAAKRYIQQLFIDGGAEQARRTIYFATDGWRAQDLRRAFTVGTELTALANGPRTWVVDEINDVDGWVAVIKSCGTIPRLPAMLSYLPARRLMNSLRHGPRLPVERTPTDPTDFCSR